MTSTKQVQLACGLIALFGIIGSLLQIDLTAVSGAVVIYILYVVLWQVLAYLEEKDKRARRVPRKHGQ